MEVIGRSKALIETSSSEERVQYKTTVVAPPNTPITATPPNTPHKSKLNEKHNICLEDISTVSIDDTLSCEEPIENRRRSNTPLAVQEDNLPKMQEMFKSLKIKNMEENFKEYNPENYSDSKYAQSSPTAPRAKMLSPDVSPISSELNSFDQSPSLYRTYTVHILKEVLYM